MVVSGTLGLAYPVTRKTMGEVAAKAKEVGTPLLIDVNWRPVFFDDHEAAKKTIAEYVDTADVVKITDEEAEWLFGISREEALRKPDLVPPLPLSTPYCSPLHQHTHTHTHPPFPPLFSRLLLS
jgi:fructokinase